MFAGRILSRSKHISQCTAHSMTNDGFHSCTCDAEGNILTVDGSGAQYVAAQYVYDALNHRAAVETPGGTTEFLYDFAGRRTSTWNAATNAATEGRIYWDGRQLAFRAADGHTYFDHQDWVGTERVRTDYAGNLAATYFSLPFGDGYSAAVNIAAGDQDPLHFAGLDQDAESGTDHAQFRNYSPAQGRWLSPDPYDGSYDITNPQSLNRYSYALNNPLSYVDPDGTSDECVDGCYDQYGNLYYGGTQGISGNSTTVNAGDGSCSMGDDSCAYGFSTFTVSTQQQLSSLQGGGGAPNNGQYTPYHPPSKLLQYATFLGCEFNKDIEQLTDEEDAQHANQIPIVFSAMATIGGLTGKVPGWAGITGAVTGGIYTIGIAAKSNQECTESVYGH